MPPLLVCSNSARTVPGIFGTEAGTKALREEVKKVAAGDSDRRAGSSPVEIALHGRASLRAPVVAPRQSDRRPTGALARRAEQSRMEFGTEFRREVTRLSEARTGITAS